MILKRIKGVCNLIGAGGTGANEAKVFDRSRENALVGTIAGMERGIFTLDFANPCGDSTVSSSVAVAGGDAAVRIYGIEDAIFDSTGGK